MSTIAISLITLMMIAVLSLVALAGRMENEKAE
jgi:hypothetical protein